MKKLLLPLCFFIAVVASAQTAVNPYPKTITVTGSAERELVPDEIYVQVELREYDKKGGGKVDIDKIKGDFLKNFKTLNLPDTALSIAAYDGYNGNPWLRKKNKKTELDASIAYLVKLTNSQQLDALVALLDDNATQNFYIQRTGHSKLAEYRKQLKIEAVKAAKDKAGYLAGAIDEKLGDAVTINEPHEYYTPYYNNMRTANVMLQKEEAMDAAATVVDFKKIKLKYDVTVVFALK